MNECGQIPGGTRLAAVAGYFYPDNPGELELALQTCLDAARSEDPPPKAIIAPHAGYIYSGPVAASAYCHFRTCADRINRVVLLGPAHRVYLQGMALSSASEFRTPLGDIRIDTATAAELLKHPDVCIMDAAHRQEHSLEVHLPFLQVLFHAFELIPLVVGDADPGAVAQVLEQLWGDEETLIVISSDLSHYHPYEVAREVDAGTAEAIERLDYQSIGPRQACGCMPVRGLLAAASNRSMTVTRYDLRNSGDTAGDKQRVVGYGAWGFY